MKITWLAHTVAKLGNRLEENEDALWPSWNDKELERKDRFTCALSDGATRTSFSSLWAKLLVEAAGRSKRGITPEVVSAAQRLWSDAISKMNLPWHAEEKVKQGSYATLLWFRLRPSKVRAGGYWRVTAIGDSCFFHVRNGELIKSFPVNTSAAFANNPLLLSSIAARNQSIWGDMSSKTIQGAWQEGDQFFLMTDAIACWLLQHFEEGSNPLSTLTMLMENPSTFVTKLDVFVSELRSSNSIKNDDTSVIWIRLGEE